MQSPNEWFGGLVDVFLESRLLFLDYFNRSELKIESKKDGSKVTECDFEANELFVSYLKKTGISVFSEEGHIPSYDERKDLKRCWILDPLDGTHSFINKFPDFGVLLALVENRRPIFGFLYFPILDKFYFAEKGQGSYLIEEFYSEKKTGRLSFETLKETAKKIDVEKPKERIVKVMLSKKTGVVQEELFLEELGKQYSVNAVRQSSCRRFAELLEGRYHFGVRFHPIHEWDLVAGDLILNEAGMNVRDLQDEFILYNTESFTIPSVKYFFEDYKLF